MMMMVVVMMVMPLRLFNVSLPGLAVPGFGRTRFWVLGNGHQGFLNNYPNGKWEALKEKPIF